MTERDRPRFVGVVHMMPLPGSPRTSPGLEAVIARAREDATALAEGGADGVIVENLGDAPFAAERVSAYVIAAMTRVVWAVRQAAPGLDVGVNVLRNDARAALSVAAATGAGFIRVNVHTGAMITDQGLIEGKARETLLERRRLGCEVRILADVMVKHAVPFAGTRLIDVALDTWHRGDVDGLIITGAGTGRPTDLADVAEVRRAVPEARIWIGSGLDPRSAPACVGQIDGAIVGTWLHRSGRLEEPLDPSRVATMRAALGG